MSLRRPRPPSLSRPATRRQVLIGMTAGIAGAATWTVLDRRRQDGGPDDAVDEVVDELLGEDRPSTFFYQAPDGPVAVPPPRREFYRDPVEGKSQTFGDLYLPASANPSMPVVVLIHGGGWTDGLGLGYMGKLAEDLASFDIAVWNIEYRRIRSGGGYPITLQDCCDAVDYLIELNRSMAGRLDLSRVAVCGHSAGGHLALWVAGRAALAPHLPGANPRQPVQHCVSLAGVADLVRAEKDGDRYLKDLLGTTLEEDAARFVEASPIAHLPTGVQVVAVHGEKDIVVLPIQSESYAEAARQAGDDARAEIVPGGNHDPWTDIRNEPWERVRATLLTMLRVPGHENMPGSYVEAKLGR